jgi:hypothetical protein
MELEGNKNTDMQKLYNECTKMMYYHTVLRMHDGMEIDGIIESVEPDHVNILVGEDVIYREDENRYNGQRQYGNPRRVRRFRQRQIPLARLLALSLLPYPYYAPPYPYYPQYPQYPPYSY